MLRLHAARRKPLSTFDTYWAAQLNDTHPAIAIAELMRLLVDDHAMDWDQAWAITQRTCGYTNHTLLAEALERWPVALFGGLLPRHLEIVYEINRRFLDEIRLRHPGDDALAGRLSVIEETGNRSVRMAHLACVGSHAINGVAALHTELLKQTVLSDFHRVTPEKFVNVTNGVTPRRWLALSNPRLSALITSRIGDAWLSDLEHELQRIEPFAADAGFQGEWCAVKRHNKEALAAIIKERTGVAVDPESLFDVQVKRLHEYKRQHLNVLYLITLYSRLTRAGATTTPRTVIFAGKAAPGYRMAKLIIKLINAVADGHQRRPARLIHAQGRVRAGFQREAGPARLSGRRPVGTDFDGREGSVRHGQHEIRPERRRDDRHPRWRQRRDPRCGGPRQLLPVRPQRRGCRTDASRGLLRRRTTTSRTMRSATHSTSSTADASAIARCSSRSWSRC